MPGFDWEGLFDYLNELTKVVYLPRTEGISSTMLRAETTTDVKLGVIGCGRVANRFPLEAGVVVAFPYKEPKAIRMCQHHGGRPTTLNFDMKTRTRARSTSTSGMVLVFVMRFRSSYLALLTSASLLLASEEEKVFVWLR